MPEERLLQVFHWWMQMQKEGFLQKQEKAGSPPPAPLLLNDEDKRSGNSDAHAYVLQRPYIPDSSP